MPSWAFILHQFTCVLFVCLLWHNTKNSPGHHKDIVITRNWLGISLCWFLQRHHASLNVSVCVWERVGEWLFVTCYMKSVSSNPSFNGRSEGNCLEADDQSRNPFSHNRLWLRPPRARDCWDKPTRLAFYVAYSHIKSLDGCPIYGIQSMIPHRDFKTIASIKQTYRKFKTHLNNKLFFTFLDWNFSIGSQGETNKDGIVCFSLHLLFSLTFYTVIIKIWNSSDAQ